MVEGGKWWSQRKVAKADVRDDARGSWWEDRFTGGISGGLMKDVGVGNRTVEMEGQKDGMGMMVAEEDARLDRMSDEEETSIDSNNSVVAENVNGDGGKMCYIPTIGVLVSAR
ncbi:hypothetical protein NDU88_000982 [Pleurodeles waltl]|uniref:Uncharacterized protein n=1 Tax=Pleurodeles waltl TaxID=8319 RepID=A0AAV7S9L8_PLEWA|nr:hypothetical protein NDU88_000982 [Pleurodeles waltl]